MGIRILVRAVDPHSPRLHSPSFTKVKTSVRAGDRRKKKAFPSEYSFAICPISLAFLTEPCAEGDKKNKNKINNPSPHHRRAYTYPISVYIYAIRCSQQFQPLWRSPFYFVFIHANISLGYLFFQIASFIL